MAKKRVIQKALEILQRKAKEHEDLGEVDQWSAAENAAEKIEGWLKQGARGEPPVDLKLFGIDLAQLGEPETAQVAEVQGRHEAGETQLEEAITIPAAETQVIEKPQPQPSAVGEETLVLPVLERVVPAEVVEAPSNEKLTAEMTSIEIEELGTAQGAVEETVQEQAAQEVPEDVLIKESLNTTESGALEPQIDAPAENAGGGVSAEKARTTYQMTSEWLKTEPEALQQEEALRQQQMREELRKSREDYDRKRYSDAVNRARQLRDMPALPQSLKDAVEDILQLANQELNRQIIELLNQGDQARQAGDLERARSAYNTIIKDLDPDHQLARSSLFELEKAQVGQLNKAQHDRLFNRLGEQRNIRLLGDAVYEAEAWRSEGRLPDDLNQRLVDARQFYDGARITMGQSTTMMRYGDLRGRSKAVDDIRQRVIHDEPEILDATLNRFRPTVEVLRESQTLLEEISETTAQYEIDRVKQALPAYPLWAKERLDHALEQPFHEHHARKLENLRQEVNECEERKDQAESLLSDAAGNDDPLTRLGLVLRAQAVFPYLEGLQRNGEQEAPLVLQAMQTAVGWLSSQVEHNHDVASVHLQGQQYEPARQQVTQARALIGRWPQVERPAAIVALDERIRALGKTIDLEEAAHNEFTRQVNAIREKVTNPSQKAAAMQIWNEVKEEKRFQHFPELRNLLTEMDLYADLSDQIRDMRQARDIQDWTRAREISEIIIKSGKAGEFTSEVEEVHEQAIVELEIAQAKEYLGNDDVVPANTILSKLIQRERNEEKRLVLKSRLKPELDKISDCVQINMEFQPLFDRAKDMSQKKGVAERLEAFLLFRYIGGLDVEKPEPEWPKYRLSLRTTDARKLAREVGVGLRKDLLARIQEAYQKKQAPQGDDLANLNGYAEALRKANLLEAEEERAAVRWVEVEYARQRTQARERLGDWDGLVKIWGEINRLYPLQAELENGLHQARIQQVIHKAEGLLVKGMGDMALRELRTAQEDPALARSWRISLVLAETHARQGNFTQAFRSLSDAERLVELQGVRLSEGKEDQDRSLIRTKRTGIEREQAIQQVETKVRNEWQGDSANAREALRILQKALAEPPTDDSRRLKNLREDIFNRAEEDLLKTARTEKGRGSDDGKIRAVAALVDLREIENILKRPEKDCRSVVELDSLRTELAPAATAVISSTRGFDPNILRLEQAISEVTTLTGRLQSFSSVIPLFKEELEDIKENLERQRNEITRTAERLRKLQALLKEASETNLWEQALLNNSFDLIEQYHRQIQQLDLNGMLEVQNFGIRLQEWKEIHLRLLQEIDQVKRLFEQEEEFDAVVVGLRRLRVRYDLRSDGSPWKQVQQNDYEKIIYTMSPKLRIVDIHGESEQPFLEGWEEVERTARVRAEETSSWDTWRGQCSRLGMQNEQYRQSVESDNASTPLRTQKKHWVELKDNLEQLSNLLQTGPLLGVNSTGKHSQKVKNYEKDRQVRVNEVYADLVAARTEIAKIDGQLEGDGKGFPTTREFDQAVKHNDWISLERLINRAKRVGASNAREEALIRTYEIILENKRNEPKPGNGGIRWPWKKD